MKAELERDKYFISQSEYTKIHGPKTIVFYHMGTFYEAYSNNIQGYQKLGELEEILGIKYIRNLATGDLKTDTKPNQFGIPCVSMKKNMAILLENGYTIVIFDQERVKTGKKFNRVFAGVYTSSINIDEDKPLSPPKYLMTLYATAEPQLRTKITLVAVGVTIIDISTGYNIIHEFHSSESEQTYAVEETNRLLTLYMPSELVVYFQTASTDCTIADKFKKDLQTKDISTLKFFIAIKNKPDPADTLGLYCSDIHKISYQNNILSETFRLAYQSNISKNNSPIEILDIVDKIWGRISYIMMIVYINIHNSILLKNLTKPDIFTYDKHLSLGNDAIGQLEIISTKSYGTTNKKIESLFDIINKTVTPMGNRYLLRELSNPYSQELKSVMIDRYDMIEELITDDLCDKIHGNLKWIGDLERLHRLMAIGKLTPFMWFKLNSYYVHIQSILNDLADTTHVIKKISKSTIQQFNKFVAECQKIYDFDITPIVDDFRSKFVDCNIHNKHYLRKNIYPDLELIQTEINNIFDEIDAIAVFCTQNINKTITKPTKSTKSTKPTKKIVEKVYTDKDGFALLLSKTNALILKRQIKTTYGKKSFKIGTTHGNIKLSLSDMVFKHNTNGTKISLEQILNNCKDTINGRSHVMNNLANEYFIDNVSRYYDTYWSVLNKVTKFISFVDFITSGALVAKAYSYCKPIIPSRQNKPSYIMASQLRHPIVEKLCVDTEYVPNDIKLGNIDKANGMLLFAVNTVGKSSLMKSVGIAIILAQIGWYVPASEFVFEPYMALYARINANDDIHNGKSTYSLEMTEIKSIMKRCTKQGLNTLVIGDEVCKGTNPTEATALVIAILKKLISLKTTFIFSSHLREVATYVDIVSCEYIHIYHLTADYDKKLRCYVYHRKLTPGAGPINYAIQIAEHLLDDPDLVNDAYAIQKNISGHKIIDKTSNYNTDLYMKQCKICHYRQTTFNHKELDTHHIIHQSKCDPDGKLSNKPHWHKDDLSNLVALCKKCHVKVHSNYITITGWSDTSIGPMLVWSYNTRKYCDDLVKHIT